MGWQCERQTKAAGDLQGFPLARALNEVAFALRQIQRLPSQYTLINSPLKIS